MIDQWLSHDIASVRRMIRLELYLLAHGKGNRERLELLEGELARLTKQRQIWRVK